MHDQSSLHGPTAPRQQNLQRHNFTINCNSQTSIPQPLIQKHNNRAATAHKRGQPSPNLKGRNTHTHTHRKLGFGGNEYQCKPRAVNGIGLDKFLHIRLTPRGQWGVAAIGDAGKLVKGSKLLPPGSLVDRPPGLIAVAPHGQIPIPSTSTTPSSTPNGRSP